MQRVMQAYFNTTATTTSPGDVIIMLYDGAISFLERAKQKITEKDYAQKGILISKAMDVISELDGSLNIDKGGNLAENLHSLYFFCNTHLLQANMKMDIEKIDKVIAILTDLRDAFATIVNTPEAVQAAQTNAMSQRAQAPQVRMPVSSAPAPSSIGNARASSLYSKNIQAFASSQGAPSFPSSPGSQMEQTPHADTPQVSPVMTVDTPSAAEQPVVSEPAPQKTMPPAESHVAPSAPANSMTPHSSTGNPSAAQNSASTPVTPDSKLPLSAQTTVAAQQPKVSSSTTPSGVENASATISVETPEVAHTPQPATLTPPSRLESRFQGAALYKKFAQS